MVLIDKDRDGRTRRLQEQLGEMEAVLRMEQDKRQEAEAWAGSVAAKLETERREWEDRLNRESWLRMETEGLAMEMSKRAPPLPLPQNKVGNQS